MIASLQHSQTYLSHNHILFFRINQKEAESIGYKLTEDFASFLEN
jgi:hypothetical protein